MSGKLEKLSERIGAVEKRPLRRAPGGWFGFRSAYPIHAYDPPNARFDLAVVGAWEWFCLLQMTATELDEYIAISVWNSLNGNPLIVYGTPPDLQAEAEAHDNRKQELEQVAQHRAEELDRKDPDAWPRCGEFFKRLEQQQDQATDAADEPTCDESVDDTPIRKQMRLLWAWRLQCLEAYRKYEVERSSRVGG